MVYLLYILIGISASFLSGLLGIGGGLILVPALLFVFSHYQVVVSSELMHMVIGTSLASSLVNLVSSVRAHHLRQTVQWPIVKLMAPGLLLGALLLGPGLVRILPNTTLKACFGVFCLLMGLQLLRREPQRQDGNFIALPHTVGLLAWGLLVGVLSTLLGLAGGVMLGLVFTFYRMPMRTIIGTGSACALIIAAAATMGLSLLSGHPNDLPKYSTGFIYWPALVCIALPALWFARAGAAVAHRLPVQRLRQVFAALVLVVGLQILWTTY